MERIDIGRELAVVVFDDEMSGQPDAGHRLAQPPRDLDVDYRKRDRNAGASIQNIIEAIVAGIVIVDFITVEAQLFKEIPVGDLNKITARNSRGQA